MNLQKLAAIAALLSACGGFSSVDLGTESLTEDADGITRVEIHQGSGDVLVHGDPDAASIELRVTLFGPDAGAEATSDYAENLSIHLDLQGDVAMVHSDDLGSDPRYWIETEVILPTNLAVLLDDATGDADVWDVASLEVQDGTGDLKIDAVAGDVIVLDGTGDLQIIGVGGSVELEDDSGDARIEAVQGDVDVVDETGSLDIVDVGGNATIVDGTGDIRIRDVRGTIRIEDGSGDIDVVDSGEVDIVEDSTGNVRIR